MGDTYSNTASDSSSVGAQISRAEKSVTVHQTAAPTTASYETVVQELVRLRALLEEAIASRDLDPALAIAARSSLDAAEAAAAGTAEPKPRRERLTRALSTLKAAVSGVAGLSDSVAALIRSVDSFS